MKKNPLALTERVFLPPWSGLSAFPDSDAMVSMLEAEAKAEIASGHPLFKKPLQAVARRDDCDDVLFRIRGSEAFALVHLTYARRPEPCPWPQTMVFPSWESFAAHMASKGGA